MSTKLSKYLKYYLKCDTINSVWCKQTTTAAIKKPPSSRDIFFFFQKRLQSEKLLGN